MKRTLLLIFLFPLLLSAQDRTVAGLYTDYLHSGTASLNSVGAEVFLPVGEKGFTFDYRLGFGTVFNNASYIHASPGIALVGALLATWPDSHTRYSSRSEGEMIATMIIGLFIPEGVGYTFHTAGKFTPHVAFDFLGVEIYNQRDIDLHTFEFSSGFSTRVLIHPHPDSEFNIIPEAGVYALADFGTRVPGSTHIWFRAGISVGFIVPKKKTVSN